MVASVQPFQTIPTSHAMAVFRVLKDLPRGTRSGIRRSMYDIGTVATRDMVTRLTTGQRSGRLYKVRGRIVRASAPGEFPAKRTGGLARSANYSVRGASELEVGARSRFGKPIGEFLEFGTRFMDRRPFIEPTSERHAQTFATLLLRHAPVALDRGRGRLTA